MQLTFESRPIVLPAPWQKSAPLGNLFASEPIYHNEATATAGRSIHVLGPRWAFAASWRRRENTESKQPIIVEIDLQVSSGAVGIGCVIADFSRFVGKEIGVSPDVNSQTIQLSLEDHAVADHLVLRNIDPAGRKAHVTIGKIFCFAAIRNSDS